MTDIIPMLDELHPLLDSTVHQPAQGHELDDGSADEARHKEDEDDEEGHEEKDYGAEAAISWTADDHKNLMDLGTSELERNQRLENLVVKRRARKHLRFETERNLVDLGSSDTEQFMEHVFHLLVQIPHISAPRRDPFDLLYDADETMGLSPIPGSAPPVLLPRQSPFDFAYDERDESDNLADEGSNSRCQNSMAASQQNVFFHRHESFAVGASSSGEFNQERHHTMLEPYFVPEGLEPDETGFARYQRQSSELSDSKVSSVPESELISSVTDQEDHKELIEQELHHEDKQSSRAHHVSAPLECESHSSFEVDSVVAEQQTSGRSVGDDHGAVEDNIEFSAPFSGAAKLEVIEEKLEDCNLEKESGALINPTTNVALTGLKMIEEHHVGLCDVDLSFLQDKYVEAIGTDDTTSRMILEARNGNSSAISPMLSFHDGTVTGLGLLKPDASMIFLSLTKVKSEFETEHEGDLVDLRANITGPLHCRCFNRLSQPPLRA